MFGGVLNTHLDLYLQYRYIRTCFQNIGKKAIYFHYVKSVRIRSFSGPYFPAFVLNTSFRMRENTDQKNSNTDTFYVVFPTGIVIIFDETSHVIQWLYCYLNLFLANVSILHLMKTLDSKSFSGDFSEYKRVTLAKYRSKIFLCRGQATYQKIL